MYSSFYPSNIPDIRYHIRTRTDLKMWSGFRDFLLGSLLIDDKYVRDTRNNWSTLENGIRLKTWGKDGNSWSRSFEIDFCFVNKDSLQIKYAASTQSKKREKIFKKDDGQSLDEILDIIEGGLAHFETLKIRARAKEVKNKIDMISVHSRIGEIIGEDKEELINFHYHDNDMSFAPKKPGAPWRLQFLKHKSKKDSYSFKMKGRWNFNEEQLLKILEGFLGAVKDPSNKKK